MIVGILGISLEAFGGILHKYVLRIYSERSVEGGFNESTKVKKSCRGVANGVTECD